MRPAPRSRCSAVESAQHVPEAAAKPIRHPGQESASSAASPAPGASAPGRSLGCRATTRRSPLAVREPPLALQRAPQDELDLPVDAAQLVAGPPLQGREDLRIDAQQERLAGGHPATGAGCRC